MGDIFNSFRKSQREEFAKLASSPSVVVTGIVSRSTDRRGEIVPRRDQRIPRVHRIGDRRCQVDRRSDRHHRDES